MPFHVLDRTFDRDPDSNRVTDTGTGRWLDLSVLTYESGILTDAQILALTIGFTLRGGTSNARILFQSDHDHGAT